MDTACLDYRLTEAERIGFEQNGFLVVENVLPPEIVKDLTALVDRLDRLEWHQDSGRLNVDFESNPRPRISLKVGYFLTDTTEVGRGNFCRRLWAAFQRLGRQAVASRKALFHPL
jgi:hypothetical protein